jgi:hypothetical protein
MLGSISAWRKPTTSCSGSARHSLQREVALLQKIHGDVMQQCGEPHILSLLRRSAHSHQAVPRGCPALSPDRGRLIAVPLRRSPSLHRLRQGRIPFVQRLHRYYGFVRLLIHVLVHRSASAFMNRPGRAAPGVNEISQVPVKGRLHVHEVYDGARSIPRSPSTREMVLSSVQRKEIGTSKLDPFRRSILSPWSPL